MANNLFLRLCLLVGPGAECIAQAVKKKGSAKGPEKRLRDFDGAPLAQLLASGAAAAPSVAFALPKLHGIGATHMCIDVTKPVKKEFFWRGKSDGKWLSHEMFRAHYQANGTSSGRSVGGPHLRAGADPCTFLDRLRVPVPDVLKDWHRRAAADFLQLQPAGRDKLTLDDMRAKMVAAKPVPPAAHFLLRRRLVPMNDSVLRLGARANLDVNRFNCPTHLALVGCHGAEYDRPFLGAFRPAVATGNHSEAAEWVDRIPAAPPFKYCRRTETGVAQPPVTRIPGVAVLLPELHANLNVGHAAKDLVFLAHLLQAQREQPEAARARPPQRAQSFRISTILVDDKASATGNLSFGQQGFHYRKACLEALVAGHQPPIHVAYLQQGALATKEAFGQDIPWQGSRSVCFDAVVQKGLAYAGDWRGAALFRRQVYGFCDIPPASDADAILVVIHGVAHSGKQTRRWFSQEALVQSLKERAFRRDWCQGGVDCKPLELIVKSMEGLSFCDQARLYARSRVVITHHGASLANGLFLRAESLMVEINRQWDNSKPRRFTHVMDGAGYAGLFLSSGVAYIGARVAYGVWQTSLRMSYNAGHPDSDGRVTWRLDRPVLYDFNDANMAIGINETRWAAVLEAVDDVVLRRVRVPSAQPLDVREAGPPPPMAPVTPQPAELPPETRATPLMAWVRFIGNLTKRSTRSK